jgi:chitin disaccharide deacetylase
MPASPCFFPRTVRPCNHDHVGARHPTCYTRAVNRAKDTKRIVTRGDDAGSFSSANVALAEAAELFRTRPAVVLGLHVTLNAEWNEPKWGPRLPPERVPSLVDGDGHFFPSPMETFQHGLDLDEAMREVSAQLDEARRHGLSIRYIDEHMGIGWVHPPGKESERLETRLKKLAEDEGLIWHGKVPGLPSASALRLVRPDGANDEDALLARIDQAPPGTYVVYWHPAHESDETRAASFAGSARGVIAKERAADFALATSTELERGLAARGVRCIGYDEA